MKILQVIPYFYPAWRFGGPVKVAYDISRKLVERGHSVTVYTSDILDEKTRVGDAYKNVDGVDVYYFRNLSLYAAMRKMYVTPSLLSALKNVGSFDVVHVHGNRTTQGPLIHYFLKKNSVPYVVQSHGGLPRENKAVSKRMYDRFFGYSLLHDASKVIALTPREVLQYQGIGIPEEKIEVIPNGIDLSEYATLPPENSFRRKFNIGTDEKLILYLARINKIKGVDILVRAFADLVEKLDHVKLVIAGPDDGYLENLKFLVKNLNISHNVIFSGPLYGKDKLEAFNDAEIYVLPSRYETFPMSVLEAIACQTPVLLTINCGIADYFKDKTGLVVELDPHSIADAMLEMLLCTALYSTFKANCSKVINDYGINNVVSKLEKVYDEIYMSQK